MNNSMKSMFGNDLEEFKRGNQLRLHWIEINNIHPDPNNPYSLDEEDIRNLAENIRDVGLLSPLVVVKENNGQALIVSGHRRYAALSKLAEEDGEYKYCGLTIKNDSRRLVLPCTFVERLDDTDSKARLVKANNQRRKTDEERKHDIDVIEEMIISHKEQGENIVPKGTRVNDYIAAMTGDTANFVHQYLAKKHRQIEIDETDINDEETNGVDSTPTNEELEKEQLAKYKKIKKQALKLTEMLEEFDLQEFLEVQDKDMKLDSNDWTSSLGDMLNNLVRKDV